MVYGQASDRSVSLSDLKIVNSTIVTNPVTLLVNKNLKLNPNNLTQLGISWPQFKSAFQKNTMPFIKNVTTTLEWEANLLLGHNPESNIPPITMKLHYAMQFGICVSKHRCDKISFIIYSHIVKWTKFYPSLNCCVFYEKYCKTNKLWSKCMMCLLIWLI